ncbi:MAG: hypothetical protein AB1714_02515 [Acidobacteriota bacterium]
MRQNRWAVAGFLALFLFVLASVNFSHTEESISSNDHCPACNYGQSIGTPHQVNLSPPCQLVVVEMLQPVVFSVPRRAWLIIPLSRSPPLA